MPARPAPFETPPVLTTVLSVSLSAGIAFNAAVTCPGLGGDENSLLVNGFNKPSGIPAQTSVTTLTVNWYPVVPSVGDPWVFTPPPNSFTADDGHYAPASGVVVA